MNVARFLPAAFLIATIAAPLLEADELSLKEAIDLAVAHNPALKATELEGDAAAHGVEAARAAWFPRLDLSITTQETTVPGYAFMGKMSYGGFTMADFAPAAINDPDPVSASRYGLEVRQPLYSGGAVAGGYEAARAGSDAARHASQRRRDALVFEVREAYYACLLADERLSLAREALETSDAMLARTRQLFEDGLVLKSDLLRCQVRRATYESDLSRAEHDRTTAYRKLVKLMGVDSAVPVLSTKFSEVAPPPRRLIDMEGMLAGRADYMAEQARRKMLSGAEKAARAAFLPRAVLFAGGERNHEDLWNDGQGDYYFGVSLQLNVFRGGADRARLASARLERRAQELRLEEMRRGMALDLFHAEGDLDDAHRQAEIARDAVEPAEEAYRILFQRYGEGMVTVDELLAGELALHESKMRYASALYQLEIARANYDLVTGSRKDTPSS
ncbi:MAG: TolC family protein [Acidobacteriota bacterium]|nr:MAG: TolC family protein [Acidobacteriota bacterium]